MTHPSVKFAYRPEAVFRRILPYLPYKERRAKYYEKSKTNLWGVILICVGLLLGLNAFGITSIELFFDGWWTLFIIVPCFMGLFSDHDKTGNLIGLCVGVFLLLCCRNILSFDTLWKLVFPAIVILIGAKLIFGSFFGGKEWK
ncbi:MAG: LiaF transmembrane domain-containing protein [Faecousia sp.]